MNRSQLRRRRAGLASLAVSVALGLLAHPVVAGAVADWFGGARTAAYGLDRLADLALSHATIALLAVVPAGILGMSIGILVTRQAGRDLRPLSDVLVAASQAVPPVVVVALAFPAFGFGAVPTVLALACYIIMPVLRGTTAAIEAVPADVKEAARAMGMKQHQVLWQVELPLAAPVIGESFRTAVTLAIATAAVGALAGAATLGTPIIVGLQNQNEVYILQGAAATGALAFLADALLLLAMAAGDDRQRPGTAFLDLITFSR